MTLTVGSLFAGIGGFDLGFERAGMRTVWFCEQDPYCQRVLARHWSGVPCYPDVRALVGDAVSVDGGQGRSRGSDSADSRESESGRPLPLPVSVPPVDVLCGGFPCQDLSTAGRGAGIHGARSGLWFEFLRLIGELRPRYVVVENVPQLRKYLGVVTGGLAEIGYDAEWDVISAADFGAPHLRKRLWLVAYPDEKWQRFGGRQQQPGEAGPRGYVHQWGVEPDVGRVANGVPHRVDRLRSLGNALVPQIAEWIGRMIVCDAS